MNHSNKKRGEVKTAEELEKDKIVADRVSKALSDFLAVRKNWRDSGKTIDELLKYSQKLVLLMGETPTVYNFREDQLIANFDEIFAKGELNTKKNIDEFVIGNNANQNLQKDEKVDNNQNPINEVTTEVPDKPEQKVYGGEEQELEKKRIKIEGVKSTLTKFGEILKSELEFQVGLAMKDPKCYQLWFHRKWLLTQAKNYEFTKAKTSDLTKKILQMELLICRKFLDKDERNFHAWNYRSYIVNFFIEAFPQEKIDLIKNELKYLNEKLNNNFSNFSALHFKSKYIVQLASYEKQEDDLDIVDIGFEIFESEYTIIETGLCMVTYEQSLWIYQRWLSQVYTLQSIESVCYNSDKNDLVIKQNYPISNKENYVLRIYRGHKPANIEKLIGDNNSNDKLLGGLDFEQAGSFDAGNVEVVDSIDRDNNNKKRLVVNLSGLKDMLLNEPECQVDLLFGFVRKNSEWNKRVLSQSLVVGCRYNKEINRVVDSDGNMGNDRLFEDKMTNMGEVWAVNDSNYNIVKAFIEKNLKLIGDIYEQEKSEGRMNLNKDAVFNEYFLYELLIKSGYLLNRDNAKQTKIEVIDKMKDFVCKLEQIDSTSKDAEQIDYYVHEILSRLNTSIKTLQGHVQE